MTQNNPFAKLGALDQKLYQDTAPKPVQEISHPTTTPDPIVLKPNTRDSHKKPANLQAGKLETKAPPTLNTVEKVEKYSTRLKPSLVKRLKIYVLEHDIKNDYDIVQAALTEYMDKNK